MSDITINMGGFHSTTVTVTPNTEKGRKAINACPATISNTYRKSALLDPRWADMLEGCSVEVKGE